VLRGEDTYKNLPNKTLRLLRYALAHPAGYTHVMKTDDDCYVRISKVGPAQWSTALELVLLLSLHPRLGTPFALESHCILLV
jgi:hypothetical protein